ncbi:hypothetical protein BC332_20572 [Capsicum chinense]|nr:hypothetical protein BC332_20572 [Capsicum chinense]
MIEGFQLKEVESGFPPADYFDKRLVVDVQSQVNLDIQGFEEFNTVPPTEILKMASLITDASTSHPTKKQKIVRFDSTTAEEKDVAGCNEDNATANLDTLVESVVNHNSNNTNVRISTTVHIHNDHMVDYSSTLPESIQLELDAILKVIAAPVDDVPIEVILQAESVVNQHDISNSQLPLDFSDVVVAAHQAAKTPTKIAKRIRMRSKVFKSPYTTKYASGSKAIEDQIEEQKQQFAFDGFLISDTMPSSVIEEFKQWVKEGLLKFHAKKDCGVFIAGYVEYLSKEMNAPSDGFEAKYHRMCYATLLQKYGIQKAKKGYVSENDDPPRPKSRIIQIPDDNAIVCIK